MQIGIDARHAPWEPGLQPAEQVDEAARRGMGGIFFRTMLDISPTLDPSRLREVRARADAHGMYLEAGLGLVNTYAIAETPAVRAIGDGDTLAGYRRMIEAAAAIGITELWASTGGHKPYGGRFAYDRYRSDVSWSDQLLATEKFLHLLAPIARAHGVHINVETHEEITTFELVRLVESVGPDVMGITYDTANPLQRAEHPRRATDRIAPYVRQTHLKDVALFFDPSGIRVQPRPLGQGVIDLGDILPALARTGRAINLSLESSWSPPRALPRPEVATGLALYDPEWVQGHPDLTVAELAEFLGLVQGYADRVARKGADPLSSGTIDGGWDWIEQSTARIRSVLDTLELAS